MAIVPVSRVSGTVTFVTSVTDVRYISMII